MKATALSLKALIKGNTQINNAKKPQKLGKAGAT